jgi:Uncharacterized conserved protein (DUF2285)
MFAGCVVLSEISDNDGRHLVLQNLAARHRLLLARPQKFKVDGYLVQSDQWLDVRLDAISQFHRRSETVGTRQQKLRFAPSRYQRHRLSLLLRILDFVGDQEQGSTRLREIAEKLIYPHSELGPAAYWKSSSERRQTQRLRAEALYIRDAGYLALLKGKLSGKQ